AGTFCAQRKFNLLFYSGWLVVVYKRQCIHKSPLRTTLLFAEFGSKPLMFFSRVKTERSGSPLLPYASEYICFLVAFFEFPPTKCRPCVVGTWQYVARLPSRPILMASFLRTVHIYL
ncbi:unnamed protein product, partial [Scytosiphon promiscuus]